MQAPDDDLDLPRLWFRLRGRVSRRTWWLFGVLALAGIGAILYALLRIAGLGAEAADQAVSLLMVWPSLAMSVKRWHDRDKAGWWVLVVLIPFVGWLWLLVENGLLRGTPGPNRFGPPEGGGGVP